MPDYEQHQNTKQNFANQLALYVGQGKRYATSDIAAATGVSAPTLQAWLRGNSCPEWTNAIELLKVMPIAFVEAVLRPAGLTGVRRVDGEMAPATVLSETCEAVSALASALADGRIDHTERPAVLKEVTEAICALSQLAAQLGGAK